MLLGYAQALLMHRTLEAACKSDDLSRQGIVDGMRSLEGVESDALFPLKLLSFTQVGQPPTRAVYMTQVDPDADGGLTTVDTLETESAKAYEFGGT